jgi:dihydroflavonol-4-reductase
MSTVVVTGATGFIGSHLVEELVRRGEHVRCLVRADSKLDLLRSLNVEVVSVGLDEVEPLCAAVQGAAAVYHVAGVIRAFHRRDFYRVNQQGTANVAAACAKQSSPPRLMVVSSIAASGPCPRGQVRLESDPPNPQSHYGRSKLAAEEEAAKLADRVPLTIVRPGMVFGPRDTGFVQIIQAIRNFYCHLSPGFFPPALSYIHVSDLIEMLLVATERGKRVPAGGGQAGEGRYYAVAPEYPTYSELGYMLRRMLGRHYAPVIPVVAPLAYAVGGANELIGRIKGRPQELCIDKIRDALATSWACSGEAAKRELGFSPAESLRERLQETIDWCRANGHL